MCRRSLQQIIWVGSLGEAVKWWIETKMQMPPEDVAENYLKLIGYKAYE